MTAAALNRSIEKMFEDLTPEEVAKYLSDEWWRICEESTTGKDISSKIADLQRFEQNRVTTLNARDYISYMETLWELDVVAISEGYMRAVLSGYAREILLISLLIKSEERVRQFVSESTTLSNEEKAHSLMAIDERIKEYLIHRNTLDNERRELSSRSFWERRIPFPIGSEFNNSEISPL